MQAIPNWFERRRGNDDHTGTKNMASRKEIHAAGPEWGSARFAPQILWLFQILDRPEMPQVRKRDLRDIPQGARQPPGFAK